ncbi:hypothetical protein HHK36_026720 [Tetracentron sinense]|uniref:Uncharacterized protein n=1 Tax=Tetracentron sinense TaxID=13715 RepID=A0A835D5R2_TETSI|nr:hypothetical protein HHK36_026720 [Tetracentron sinense]
MEVATEVLEDDAFFADLSKQISLLIMDDDEDPVARCPSASLQDFSRPCYPSAPFPLLYEQTCRREIKGTGVFIPRSALPRRKNRQGRFTSSNNNRQPDKPRGASNVAYSIDPSTNCFNSKSESVHEKLCTLFLEGFGRSDLRFVTPLLLKCMVVIDEPDKG